MSDRLSTGWGPEVTQQQNRAESVKRIVLEAFKGVNTGHDHESYWWLKNPNSGLENLWEDWIHESNIGKNVGVLRDLLPAMMYSVLKVYPDEPINGTSLFSNLCTQNKGKCGKGERSDLALSEWDPQYLDWLKAISPKENAAYLELDQKQIYAVANYFSWWMEGAFTETDRYVFANKDEAIHDILQDHQRRLEVYASTSPEEKIRYRSYLLTEEAAVGIWQEECRILRDWLELGGVQVTPEVEE